MKYYNYFIGQIDMVFEVSPTATETQTRVEALVDQITSTLLSGMLHTHRLILI